jgi:hypothetical protein
MIGLMDNINQNLDAYEKYEKKLQQEAYRYRPPITPERSYKSE